MAEPRPRARQTRLGQVPREGPETTERSGSPSWLRGLRAPPGRRGAALLLAVLLAPLAGCLQFDQVDLYPVCEDRRQGGPSPTYTVDELMRKVDVEGAPLPEAQKRALLAAVRERVLTLQAAPYRSFEANLTLVDAGPPERWRFQARGAGGPDPAVEVRDAYDVRLVLEEGRARVEAPWGMRHPVPAPQTLAGLAWRVVNATEEVAPVRERTPRLVEATLDRDLPGCAFLLFGEAAPGEARTEVAVNLVQMRVVHVAREGW